MFQSLRPNNQIFILHKDKSLLEVGSVVSVSMPTPKYPVPQVFGQPQEMVVDVVAKVNNQDVTYQKLPANLDIADFGTNGIVVADNKLAMNSEIMSLKQKMQNGLLKIMVPSLDSGKKCGLGIVRTVTGERIKIKGPLLSIWRREPSIVSGVAAELKAIWLRSQKISMILRFQGK